MAQVVAVGQGFGDEGQAFGGCDQHPCVAVAQDVGDLLGLQDRIDRDEGAPGPGCAKARHDGLEALVEKHADALAPVKPEADEATGKPAHLFVQACVAEGRCAGGEGRAVWGTLGGCRDEFVQKRGVGHRF